MLKKTFNRLKSYLGFSKKQSVIKPSEPFEMSKVIVDSPKPEKTGRNHIARNRIKKKRKRRKIVNASKRANR